jgi:phage terminase large subunit-like protein
MYVYVITCSNTTICILQVPDHCYVYGITGSNTTICILQVPDHCYVYGITGSNTSTYICILQVPDYSHVYGITGSQTAYPDTTSVTATSSQDTDILENKRRFVKEYASYHKMDYFF